MSSHLHITGGGEGDDDVKIYPIVCVCRGEHCRAHIVFKNIHTNLSQTTRQYSTIERHSKATKRLDKRSERKSIK